METTLEKPRYVGANPFEWEQRNLFFGRHNDIRELYRMIKLEPVVVLHGKSGVGKSSLVSAGLLPKVFSEKVFFPIRIRFKAFIEDENTLDPIEIFYQEVLHKIDPTQEAPKKFSKFFDELVSEDRSMWHAVKTLSLSNYENQVPLLIFDQFEEFFTYPKEEIERFAIQLEELVNQNLPQRYWDAISKIKRRKNRNLKQTFKQLFNPLQAKILIVIRSDRQYLLNQLNDYVPEIFKNPWELSPLTLTQAKSAIIRPALASGDFDTEPFGYKQEALDSMLTFLTRSGTEPIDSTQLQIICHTLEIRAHDYQYTTIGEDEVKDLEGIIESYYENKIEKISDPLIRQKIQGLIEEALIFEKGNIRLSLYEGQIIQNFGISETVLAELVKHRLLRVETTYKRGKEIRYYEICHDSLVAPILNAKQKREEVRRRKKEMDLLKEKEIYHEKLEKEWIAEEKKLVWQKSLAIGVTLIAMGLSLLAGYYWTKAKRAEQRLDYNITTLIKMNETIKKLQSNSSLPTSSQRKDSIKLVINDAVSLTRDAKENQDSSAKIFYGSKAQEFFEAITKDSSISQSKELKADLQDLKSKIEDLNLTSEKEEKPN